MINRTAALILLLGASASADSADSISSRLQVHVRSENRCSVLVFLCHDYEAISLFESKGCVNDCAFMSD